MKINPRIKVYLAQGTTRINLILMITFFVTIASCYADFLNKKKTMPNIPWYGMFLQVKPVTAWDIASPFKR
jgi:hypothetical protein